MSVAFLGTGLMGAGFVRALLSKKVAVHVWNRSFDKAKIVDEIFQALEADGAKAFQNAADAVKCVERVHIALSDDASVDATIEAFVDIALVRGAASAGLAPGALILDHTTTAPVPTAARIEKLRARGYTYVHVPMFMGPANAVQSTGLMLVSCPQPIYERIKPILETMTGKLLYFGDRPDKAAAFKLFGNMAIFFVTAGLADIYNLGAGLGIDPKEIHSLFDDFKPGNQIDIRGKKMATGEYLPPGFELTMARKDARLMLDTAAASGTQLEVFPAIAAQMDKAIAQGHGSKDLAVISNSALERYAKSSTR